MLYHTCRTFAHPSIAGDAPQRSDSRYKLRCMQRSSVPDLTYKAPNRWLTIPAVCIPLWVHARSDNRCEQQATHL